MALDPKSTHYDAGGIETFEIIKAKLTDEQWEGYLLGNVLKYGSRINWKGQFNRDVEKINVYANLLAEHKEDHKYDREARDDSKTNAHGDTDAKGLWVSDRGREFWSAIRSEDVSLPKDRYRNFICGQAEHSHK